MPGVRPDAHTPTLASNLKCKIIIIAAKIIIIIIAIQWDSCNQVHDHNLVKSSSIVQTIGFKPRVDRNVITNIVIREWWSHQHWMGRLVPRPPWRMSWRTKLELMGTVAMMMYAYDDEYAHGMIHENGDNDIHISVTKSAAVNFDDIKYIFFYFWTTWCKKHPWR